MPTRCGPRRAARYRWLGALGLLAGLIAGSASAAVLRKGNGPEVDSLDPQRARGVPAANVLRDLYEGLVDTAPDGRLRPAAAQGWTLSEDGRAYTFELRENLRWSNGDALTAEHFAAGLRRAVDPATASQYGQLLAPIRHAEAIRRGERAPAELGVEVLGPRRLRIHLHQPTPYFLGLLTHATSYPRHPQAGLQAPPSNGAYRLHEHVLQSHLTLHRNPHYWNAAAVRIDTVQYWVTEDVNAEFQRYRAGGLDWTEQVPAGQIERLRRDYPDQLQVHPYLGLSYYGLNLDHAPLRDHPGLRRALTLAIDRELLVQRVLGNGEAPAYGFVPLAMRGYPALRPDWADWPRERRLAAARAALAADGFGAQRPPPRLQIRFNTHDDHRKIAVVVAAMWRQWLGIETELVNEEARVFFQNRRERRLTQIFRAAWIADFDDPASFLELLRADNPLNNTGHADPGYDALLDAAAAEGDAGRRLALLQQAEQRLIEALPLIPLNSYVSKRLVTPRLRGWQGNAMDQHYSKDAWFEEARP